MDHQTASKAGKAGTRSGGGRLGPVLLGGALIVVGGLLLADQLGLAEVDVWSLVGDWWPLVLIVIGGLALSDRRWIEGGTVGVIGLLLLGTTTGYGPEVGFAVIGPVILVAIGLVVLTAGTSARGGQGVGFALFSGVEGEVDPSQGRALQSTALFGAVELRVVEAPPQEGARISVLALFGGGEIRVPASVPVRVRRRAMFGGIEVNVPEAEPGDVALEIDATALFGGVEIKAR